MRFTLLHLRYVKRSPRAARRRVRVLSRHRHEPEQQQLADVHVVLRDRNCFTRTQKTTIVDHGAVQDSRAHRRGGFKCIEAMSKRQRVDDKVTVEVDIVSEKVGIAASQGLPWSAVLVTDPAITACALHTQDVGEGTIYGEVARHPLGVVPNGNV